MSSAVAATLKRETGRPIMCCGTTCIGTTTAGVPPRSGASRSSSSEAVGCVGHLQYKNKNAQRSAAHEERARAHDQPKTRRTARPKTARASVKRAAVRAHGVQIEAQEERACVNTKNELRSANQAQQKGLIPLGAQLICLSALKQKEECYLHPRLMTQKIAS